MARRSPEWQNGRGYGTKMFIISRLKKLKYGSRRRKIEGIKKSLQFLEINTEFGIKKQLARVGSRLIAAWKQWRKAKLLSTHTPPGGEDAK